MRTRPLGQVEIRQVNETDLPSLAKAHLRIFPEYFTSHLGVQFLLHYYREFVDSAQATGFVAIQGGVVVGFVFGFTDSHSFHVRFYRNNFLPLVFILVRAIVRDGVVRRSIGSRMGNVFLAIRSQCQASPVPGRNEARSSFQSRLISIGVAPEARGVGLAEELVNRLLEWFHDRGVQTVGLSVRSDNVRAMAFYRKTGWNYEMALGSSTYFFRATTQDQTPA